MRTLRLYIVVGALMLMLPVFAQAQGELHPATYYFEMGERAYNTGKYKDALDNFNRCLQTDAAYYDAYPSRAAVKERLNDSHGAVTDYSIYLEKYPDNPEVVFSRGLARYKSGLYESAVEDFSRLLVLPLQQETNTIFYRQDAFGGGTDRIISLQGSVKDYVYNYLGLATFKLKQYNKSVVCFDSAIHINPHEPDYYAHRGLAWQEQNEFNHAEADYRKALELSPEHPTASHNLGVLLARKGASNAEEQFSKAIEQNPELSYTYLERAYYRQEHNNLKGALTDYNKALELNGRDADSWLNRGLVKEKLHDLEGAYKDFTKALDIRADYEKAWLCRGNVLSKMNRLKEAVDDFSIAIVYYPSYAEAYYNRAVVQGRLGNVNEACNDLTHAAHAGMKVPENMLTKYCTPLK